MHVTSAMKARVSIHIETKMILARNIFGAVMDDFKKPKVIYKQRGTTAGTANYGTWVIDLNSTLLMENDQKFIDRTVTHELAHLITHKLYPRNHSRVGKRSPHGSDWKRVMINLGAEPSRCHSYDTSNAKVKRKPQIKQIWECDVCHAHMNLTTRSHTKQINMKRLGRNHYTLKACRQHIATYTHIGSTSATPIPIPVKPKAPKPKINRINGKRTKKVRALSIYRRMVAGFDRAAIITRFMVELDMTKAGASTYYANAMKSLDVT